ncbi:hypothetical protein [Streptomyces sp. NPDC057496]|uniref:hypothetical protein n=1 Tax=Streptomyces sp. NPDC057496 TaxID=3346149 RepID=UPI0036A61D29
MNAEQELEQELDRATRQYRKTEEAHEEARTAAIAAVVAALRGGMRPTDVTEQSPFTAAYVRRIAREHNIAPAKPGPKSSK